MTAAVLSTIADIPLAARMPDTRQDDEAFAVQIAVESLARFFPRAVARGGLLHAPTLFCTLGALAGFAAQHALRTAGRDADELFAIRGPNGENYWFGERLNATLMPDRLESASAYSILASEALGLGVSPDDLPDCLDLFERVAKSIGTEKFAAPALPPELQSRLAPHRAIEIFWEPTLAALTRPPRLAEGCPALEPAAWPGVLALVAAVQLETMQDVIAPAAAVRVFMEAAVPMSKIDPGGLRL